MATLAPAERASPAPRSMTTFHASLLWPVFQSNRVPFPFPPPPASGVIVRCYITNSS